MAARHPRNAPSQGYALLMMMFFVALLVIAVAASTPSVITQARREKEQEMIWRGQQYVRGIRLYYQKTHRFPSRLEDLYAPKTGVRFLRQLYKDPMNPADGSWRLISVGPNGQLIGSLKEHRNAFFFGAPAPQGFGGALATNAAARSPFSDFGKPSTSSPNSFSAAFQSANKDSKDGQNSDSSSPGQPASQTDNSADPDSQSLAAAAASLEDKGGRDQVFGQTIIGVGSKINRSSILRYDGAKNYLQFEFVWDATNTTGSATPVN